MGRRVFHPLGFRQRPQAHQTRPRRADRNGPHKPRDEFLSANVQVDAAGGSGDGCELVCVPAWGI